MRIIKVGSTKLIGYSISKPFLADKKKLADSFRNNPTPSEKRLREMLEAGGFIFKFQHPLHGYIADFYFPTRCYVVELDGARHDADKDAYRDEALRKKGIRTLRIKSSAMFSEPALVLREIVETLKLNRHHRKASLRKRPPKKKATKRQRPDRLHQEFMFATEGI